MERELAVTINSTIQKQANWMVKNAIVLSFIIISTVLFGLYIIQIPIYEKAKLIVLTKDRMVLYSLSRQQIEVNRRGKGSLVNLIFENKEYINFKIDSIDSSQSILKYYLIPVTKNGYVKENNTVYQVRILIEKTRLIKILNLIRDSSR